ncbi:MAG: ABC transporter permease [Desulfobacterales bacterium]|nr:ABC transporter permease [Desulfobacterales bacterium]
MEFIGVRSVFVIILTGAFTGMVLALQSYYGFKKVRIRRSCRGHRCFEYDQGIGPGTNESYGFRKSRVCYGRRIGYHEGYGAD